VVLLDEIEKAHPDVFNMLLQIMEEGRLTDSFGRHIDFKNTILIMTSNIGADRITNQSEFGFGKRDEMVGYEKMKQVLQSEVERYFRPEFINRVDELVVFHKLTHDDMIRIVDLEIDKVAKRVGERGYTLELDQAAKDYLVEHGTDEKFGARPLRRAIENRVEDKLSEAILRGEYKSKGKILVTAKPNQDGDMELVFQAPQPTETPPAEPSGQAPVGAGSTEAT
jgi:ATP-dependent Clp protease ATP-binding subunit ClpC